MLGTKLTYNVNIRDQTDCLPFFSLKKNRANMRRTKFSCNKDMTRISQSDVGGSKSYLF